jgi:hypothetical protein
MTWITIPNWDRFQHYGHYRRPPWIKNYTMLLHKDDYLDLSFAARGLLHGIWLAYADRDGLLRTTDLHPCLHGRVEQPHLESLNHAGLIALSASKPLPLSTKEELRDNSEPQPTSIKAGVTKKQGRLHQELLDRAQQITATWNGGGSDVFDEKISSIEQECRSRLSHLERERLWDQVLANQPPTLGRS